MSWIDHLRVCERCAAAGSRPGAGVTYRPPGDVSPCEWCGGELLPVDPLDCPARTRGEFCAVCAAVAGGVLRARPPPPC